MCFDKLSLIAGKCIMLNLESGGSWSFCLKVQGKGITTEYLEVFLTGLFVFQEILKLEGNLGIPRQKRAILTTPILIPESQRPPFPRLVGKVSQHNWIKI